LIVLGSINLDLIVRTPHLPAPGETTLGTNFTTAQGGKGANQAIAAARAGARVEFIGAVGADEFGGRLSAALTREGVGTGRLRTVDGPSGIAVITVDDAAENTIVVAPGANGGLTNLTEDDVDLIRSAGMLLLQLEVPLTTVTKAAKTAAAVGVPVLLNPSPVQRLPAELLAAVDILVVNEGEEAALLRTAGAATLGAIPRVVTTLGASGARYRGHDGMTAIAASPLVDAIDTTGAGDAFTGALAVALAQRRSPSKALARACAAGALATTRPGAGDAAPTKAEIDGLTGS
jgi:ribokinase